MIDCNGLCDTLDSRRLTAPILKWMKSVKK